VTSTLRLCTVRRALATCSVLAVGMLWLLNGCTSGPSTTSAATDPGGYRGGVSLPTPYTMPDMSLTDTSGRPYNLARSPSKPVTLLFFGYTNCPDICTMVLADVAKSLQGLSSADRDQIQLVFVTTDPARDHERQIKSYLARFDPSFVGLTGQLGMIKTVAAQVGVDIQGMAKLPSGGYDVGHSAQVIGFNRTSGVVLWTPGTSIGALQHDFALLVARSR
jgi:protein SCO1/2